MFKKILKRMAEPSEYSSYIKILISVSVRASCRKEALAPPLPPGHI